MTVTVKTPKKLIEVALPLDDINAACAREKSIRHGHPSTLHLWWARRPLAAARAVIFAQMVNDPGYERNLNRGVNKERAQAERERLFRIIRDLVKWENTTNEKLLAEARAEIQRSWEATCELNRTHPDALTLFDPNKVPAFHDPFSGGGAIPLEAQRLGLAAYASDLNPVAVLINKAMIEVPWRFSGCEPIGPIPPEEKQQCLAQDWTGAKGLAEDVRRYGAWVRSELLREIGALYPQAELPKEYGGGKGTVIAWLWARTVKSPNPAFSHIDVPLVSTFILASKGGKYVYVQPTVDRDTYRFEIRSGNPPEDAKKGTKLGRGASFRCLVSESPIDPKYISREANAGRLGLRLIAVVVDGPNGRLYLPPSSAMEEAARGITPDWLPELEMPDNPRWFSPPLYGLKRFGDLFTSRQLVMLNKLSSLVQIARTKVIADSIASGKNDDGVAFDAGGNGATAYGDAIAVYLAFAVSRMADRHSSLCRWDPNPSGYAPKIANTFGRQALPMVWDYVEGNPFSPSSGNFSDAVGWVAKVLDTSLSAQAVGCAAQEDAQRQSTSTDKVVSTDPPYYDNIGYADLSDFFYVWLRRSLKEVFPGLFATLGVPKDEELVATPYRHGGKEQAEEFFLSGMTEAMHRLSELAHPCFPMTIYYAFKQSETTDVGTANTGWETFLEAVLRAGLAITGTWPMRTELANRMVGSGTNALASSIVLVCRRRDKNAPSISRRDFVRELKDELAESVEVMIGGREGFSVIAPVDLAQAVIGPGMAIFSKYSSVLDADGSPMSVHAALTLINRMLIEGGDDFDSDTQFCLGWFEEYGWNAGEFGQADVLARAKGTAVAGVQDAGVVEALAGKVRLLKFADYPPDWSPETDTRTPTWEALHQLLRAHKSGGDASAGSLLARMPERSEPVRLLAYRLYTLCERNGRAEDARAYNELIIAWPHIESASHEAGHVGDQRQLDI